MAEVWKTFEIEEFRGCYFDVEVYADVTEGGSNRYGSDEPEWIEVEITNIYNPNRGKPVSKRLYSALEKEFGDWFEEMLIEEYKYA